MLTPRNPLTTGMDALLFRRVRDGRRPRATGWAALLTLLALVWQTLLRPALNACWPGCHFPEISVETLEALLELLAAAQP